MGVSILRTKLYRPPVPAGVVRRQRLIERMNGALEGPLALVSAPAGYGKSLLVRHWAESLELPCAWLSLDETDGEVAEFLAYLVAAVRTVTPEACPETEALAAAPQLPPVAVLARSLANELDALEAPFVLALDDYHRLSTSSGVHELLALLLEHPPRSPRLVVITRRDPPLPLASLRARGWLAEIRLRDLRFTAPETSAFLEQTVGLEVSPEALANLHDQAEGWVVGLQLVSLHLRDQADPDEYLRELSGDIEQPQEYLLQEVLERRSPEMQDWLLQTSILDRFCAELCESVCESEDPVSGLDGQEFIGALRRDNLFTISLDTRGRWFRYHHLFQSLLGKQLERGKDPEAVAQLHVRASEWLEGEGLVREALDHAQKTGAVGRAARLVERNWRDAMNRGNSYVAGEWLSRLAGAEVQDRPELLLAKAWQHLFHYEAAAIPPILDRLDQLLAGGAETGSFSAEAGTFRGFCSFFGGETARSLKYLEVALDRIPVEDIEFRAMTELLFALAAQSEGQLERVMRRLTEWLRDPSSLHPRREIDLLLGLVFVLYIAGRPAEAAGYISRGRGIAKSASMTSGLGLLDHMDGLFHLQRGDLDAAIRLLNEASDRKYTYHARLAVDSLVGLTLAYQANGQPELAATALESLVEFANHLGPPFPEIARSGAARLALMQGRSIPAVRWMETSAPDRDEVMIFWLEIPDVTRCRVLIAEGSAASLREAEEQLREHAERNETQHNPCQLIGVLALQAIALDKQGGKGSEASTALERALKLARPSGFLFPFLEIGPPMADLLHHRLRQEPDNGFVRQVLAALEPRTPKSAPTSTELLEPLTVREEEILELLSQRLRDKEIAEQLGISSATVKYHLRNLYQKLDVHGRRRAVERARELYLITPH